MLVTLPKQSCHGRGVTNLISEMILRHSSSVFVNNYTIYLHISVCAASEQVI